MLKTKREPLETFEADYERYVERKKVVEEEVKAEYERVLAERTEKLDKLIELTSKVVEYEDVEENPEAEITAEPTA